LRTVAAGVLVAGFVGFALANEDCDPSVDGCDSHRGGAVMWTGAVGLAALTIYDIVDAPRAARRANARHERRRSVMFAPTLLPTRANPAPAIALTGRF
jgi:hypothetical protein